MHPPSNRDTRPLDLTVLIPAYNREKMVERAILSVNSQVPAPPAELIVVDDASTDETPAVAAELGARVIRHDQNLGPSGARNTGLRAATRNWVALLDSDDEWLPGHLHALWGLRAGHVLVADSVVYVAAGNRRWQGAVARDPTVLNSPRQLLFPENFVPHSSVMLRRDVALEVGGYTEGMSHVQDLDLLVRMLERGTGVVAPVVGAIYHAHEDQRSLDRAHMRVAHRSVIEKYRDRPWWTERLLKAWDGVCAWDDARFALREGKKIEALRGLARLMTDPVRLSAVTRLLVWRRQGRRRLSELPAELC